MIFPIITNSKRYIKCMTISSLVSLLGLSLLEYILFPNFLSYFWESLIPQKIPSLFKIFLTFLLINGFVHALYFKRYNPEKEVMKKIVEHFFPAEFFLNYIVFLPCYLYNLVSYTITPHFAEQTKYSIYDQKQRKRKRIYDSPEIK